MIADYGRGKASWGISMKHRIEITPRRGKRLFSSLVRREVELGRRNRGTFFRKGRKAKNRARWEHKRYAGWLSIERTPAEDVSVEVNTRRGQGTDWQLLQAFIGFMVRNFGDQVEAMHIHFSSAK